MLKSALIRLYLPLGRPSSTVWLTSGKYTKHDFQVMAVDLINSIHSQALITLTYLGDFTYIRVCVCMCVYIFYNHRHKEKARKFCPSLLDS
jgi:hypothetical protein